MAMPCEIKLRHGFFTSDISSKIADNLGYTTDVELRYENVSTGSLALNETLANILFSSFQEIQRINPSLKFENIQSSKASLRTWIFDGK